MKHILIFILLFSSLKAFSQASQKNDEDAIKETIELFFESLEKQDSILLVNSTELDGQIWRVNHFNEQSVVDMRDVREDLSSLNTSNNFKEIPHSYDIKVHRDMAIAWVPYEFWVDGKFSHCGVDVFTLIKNNNIWKIASTAYTVEKDGCDELRKEKK